MVTVWAVTPVVSAKAEAGMPAVPDVVDPAEAVPVEPDAVDEHAANSTAATPMPRVASRRGRRVARAVRSIDPAVDRRCCSTAPTSPSGMAPDADMMTRPIRSGPAPGRPRPGMPGVNAPAVVLAGSQGWAPPSGAIHSTRDHLRRERVHGPA